MKILVLTSRYTATRDIISEDFGRQTRLFSALKKSGHDIDFFVADYRRLEDKKLKLHSINVTIKPFGIYCFLSFLKSFNAQLKSMKYDFLIASSDPLWGIIGYIFANENKMRIIYDLHDNYETYSTYKVPFFRYLDHYAIKNSDIITTVSYALKNKIKPIRSHDVFVVQNGFDDRIFKPLEKVRCRRLLKLPINAKIISYSGTIQREQGVDILLDAFKSLRNEIPDIYLALAGRFYKNEDKHVNLDEENVIYLGSLTQDKVALLINASDVAVVPNPDNDFTRYCFPYKVVEYMACNAPIVATNIGDVGRLLSGYKNSLCRPNSAHDMKNKIRLQLSRNKMNYGKTAMNNTWDNIAKNFSAILNKKINKISK